MTQEAAEKFATALLKQFGKEKEFSIELPEGHNLDLVAAALERTGCLVVRKEDGISLTVNVPENLSLA